MTNNIWQLKGKYIITGKIECVTGLHIGGNTEGFEIGGMDNPVIINPLDEKPYIPGSSLKGKLRHLSEWSLGLIKSDGKGNYPPYNCAELEIPFDKLETDKDRKQWQTVSRIGRIFGPANPEPKVREQVGPTRLSVRDTFLTEESADNLEKWLGKGIYTEAKTENAIDRVTAVANPRPIERVPAGAEFAFTLIFDVYRDDDPALLPELFAAMGILEDSTLGGGGSRGHGVIKFKDIKTNWRSVDYYKNGTSEKPITAVENKSVREIAKMDASVWTE